MAAEVGAARLVAWRSTESDGPLLLDDFSSELDEKNGRRLAEP